MTQRFNLTFSHVREFNYSHGELDFHICSLRCEDDAQQSEIDVRLEAALFELMELCPQLIEVTKE